MPHHLAGELFKQVTGTNIVHVSSTPLALREFMLEGILDMTFDAITTMAANVQAGKVRALARRRQRALVFTT
jgi:hypothetical protein